MRLGEARIEAISRAIVDRLAEDELVDLEVDEEKLAAQMAQRIASDLAIAEEIQDQAVEWLRRHKRHLVEGTSEWQIALERKRDDLAVARGYVLP